MKTSTRRLAVCLLAAAPMLANAAAIEQLNHFLANTKTARAAFTQSVVQKNGKAGQQAAGSMLILRPGKFRWEYLKPYNQLIVGDGVKLWSYDKELNQVVVKPMGASLGASPAALLAGDNALDQNFTLKDSGEVDGLDWLEATPKTQDAGFERVRIGFKGNLPQAMTVVDNFGQTTQLKFDRFERNPALSADSFRFTPPKGADVVGE